MGIAVRTNPTPYCLLGGNEQLDQSTEASHRRSVERVVHALKGSLDRPMPLDEMARVALISRYHFIRVFHRLTGVPPVRFQWATRLAYAKRLLVESDLSVIEVCFEAGYNSLGSFARRFKDMVGVPPHTFRLTARRFDRARFENTLAQIQTAADLDSGEVCGEIHGPPAFEGIVFVGLFRAEPAHGIPRACCVMPGPGRFRLAGVPDGAYRLAATAIARGSNLAQYFIYDDALRASTEQRAVVVRAGRIVAGPTELWLRPPDVFDLPMLLAVVPLLEAQVSRRRARVEAAGPLSERPTTGDAAWLPGYPPSGTSGRYQ